VRMRIGTLVTTIFVFVLALLAITLVGLSAQPATAQQTPSEKGAWAWGANNQGQLGDGTTTNRSTPVQVSSLTGAWYVAAGRNHSLGIKSNGTVWAWGANGAGQLGDTTFTQRTTPVQVSGLTDVSAVAGGIGHSLAVKNDHTAWAWGLNGTGQLGDGTPASHRTPVQVGGLTDVRYVAGGFIHSLAAVGVKDDTAPTVSNPSPANLATGVNRATVTATIADNPDGTAVDPDSVNNDTFQLMQVKPTGTVPVPGSIGYDASSNTATFTVEPGFLRNGGLPKGAYQATITTGVQDKAGNALAEDYTWRFATAGPKSN
jgi:hypothetical protein